MTRATAAASVLSPHSSRCVPKEGLGLVLRDMLLPAKEEAFA